MDLEKVNPEVRLPGKPGFAEYLEIRGRPTRLPPLWRSLPASGGDRPDARLDPGPFREIGRAHV
jgi:hypothetical protein